MHEWYAAPMEGLTGWRWRQVQHEMFGRAALYVTPFVSPNGNFSFQRKELEELDPELRDRRKRRRKLGRRILVGVAAAVVALLIAWIISLETQPLMVEVTETLVIYEEGEGPDET